LAGAYLGRGLQGFGEACLYTGCAAWAVETAGLHRSSRALGFVSTGIWGGISTGPLVGNLLGSFHWAAAMQVIMAIAAFALASTIREDHEPHPEAGKLRGISGHLLFSGFAVGFVNIH
jgi:MFS family permease